MKRNSAAIKERKAGKRWQLCKPVLSLTSLPVNRSDLMDSAASTERKAIGNVSKLVHKESMWLPDSQAAVCEIRQSFVWFGDGIVALQETLLSPFPMALSCWSWDPSMYAAKMMTTFSNSDSAPLPHAITIYLTERHLPDNIIIIINIFLFTISVV